MSLKFVAIGARSTLYYFQGLKNANQFHGSLQFPGPHFPGLIFIVYSLTAKNTLYDGAGFVLK